LIYIYYSTMYFAKLLFNNPKYHLILLYVYILALYVYVSLSLGIMKEVNSKLNLDEKKILKLSTLNKFKDLTSQTDKKKLRHFFRLIITNLNFIECQYEYLLHEINKDLIDNHTVLDTEKKEALTEKVSHVIILSNILEHTYLYYFYEPGKAIKYQTENELFNAYLKTNENKKCVASDKGKPIYSYGLISEKLRTITAVTNPRRLLAIRIKKILDVATVLKPELRQYKAFATSLDKVADPVLKRLSLIYFIPRLVTNLALVCKHTIPGFWLDEKEKSLGWSFRLKNQVKNRWLELANDSAWTAGAMTNYFILAPSSAYLIPYFSFALYFIDVLLATLRFYNKKRTIQAIKAENGTNKEYIQYLENLEQYETSLFKIGMILQHCFMLSMSMTLPFFAVNPFIPLTGLLLACVARALGPILEQKVENSVIERPKNAISKFSLFSQSIVDKNQTLQKSTNTKDAEFSKETLSCS